MICAVAIVREDGAVVLQLRDNKPDIFVPNTWVLPGGHREKDESLEECAWRELKEETGYEAEGLFYLMTLRDDFDLLREPYDLGVFWTRYDGKQRIECFEGQEARFVTYKEAKGLKCSPFLLPIWDLVLIRAGI